MAEGGIGLLVGGVGLFLLGMMLMTEGLKTAAGPALGRVLSSSTQTRMRGLLSGVFITALIQSSSAVTVAAIGFVNAGLLTFPQSLWVLFGANVGTTMTGWLVALVGLKIKIEAAALPMIGIGMAMRIMGSGKRYGAIGGAIAGFGVLFLGIGLLQQAFTGLDQRVDLAQFGGRGLWSIFAFVLAGLLLTVLMQSSSASLAVVLTVAESGLLPLQEAAAAVIGANIGTTVTALLAVIGATPNARRAASAHVLFNLITGAAALALLPLLIAVVDHLRVAFELDASPAVALALFHTVFNILGVLLMWPIAARLAKFLGSRFLSLEEELGRPRYLDKNVVSVPSLGVDALRRELVRYGGLSARHVKSGLNTLVRSTPTTDPAPPAMLGRAIADFVTQLSRASMSGASAVALAQLLRVQRYYESCIEPVTDIAGGDEALRAIGEPALRGAVDDLLDYAGELLEQLDPSSEPFAVASEHQLEKFETLYQAAKGGLLDGGARAAIGIDDMERLLRSLSGLRRSVDQAGKAARFLAGIDSAEAVAP